MMTEEEYIKVQRLTALRYVCDILKDIKCIADDERITDAFRKLTEVRNEMFREKEND